MNSRCMFREDISAPIFISDYNYESGTISCVSDDKFKYPLDEYFSKSYDVPSDISTRFSKDYFILAMQLSKGLVAFNFYNVGVTTISKSGIYVFAIDDNKIKHLEDKQASSKNLFNYDKISIGTYKTRVYQLDIPQQASLLMVDVKGNFLTDTGIVSTGVTTGRDVSEIQGIKSSVPAWRKGYDGTLIDNDGTSKVYKVVGNGVEFI